MYKLSDFGLNKQSLKRKLKEIKDLDLKSKLEKTLDSRTSVYDLKTIEFIVNGFYSNILTDSDEPLSVYYAIKNREKFKTLKGLIEIKKSGSIKKVLKKEIKNVVEKSHENFSTYVEYTDDLNELAIKYGILPNEIFKMANEIENNWLELCG